MTFDPFDPKTWGVTDKETPKPLSSGEEPPLRSWTFGIGGATVTMEGENITAAFARAMKGLAERDMLPLAIRVGADENNPTFGVTSLALLRACSMGYLDESWIDVALDLMETEEELVSRVIILDLLHPRAVRRHLLSHFGRGPQDMEL